MAYLPERIYLNVHVLRCVVAWACVILVPLYVRFCACTVYLVVHWMCTPHTWDEECSLQCCHPSALSSDQLVNLIMWAFSACCMWDGMEWIQWVAQWPLTGCILTTGLQVAFSPCTRYTYTSCHGFSRAWHIWQSTGKFHGKLARSPYWCGHSGRGRWQR